MWEGSWSLRWLFVFFNGCTVSRERKTMHETLLWQHPYTRGARPREMVAAGVPGHLSGQEGWVRRATRRRWRGSLGPFLRGEEPLPAGEESPCAGREGVREAPVGSSPASVPPPPRWVPGKGRGAGGLPGEGWRVPVSAFRKAKFLWYGWKPCKVGGEGLRRSWAGNFGAPWCFLRRVRPARRPALPDGERGRAAAPAAPRRGDSAFVPNTAALPGANGAPHAGEDVAPEGCWGRAARSHRFRCIVPVPPWRPWRCAVSHLLPREPQRRSQCRHLTDSRPLAQAPVLCPPHPKEAGREGGGSGSQDGMVPRGLAVIPSVPWLQLSVGFTAGWMWK